MPSRRCALLQRATATLSSISKPGRRGSRQGRVAGLLCQLTGAEAALVVNNNASAVLLGLAAVASGREVIVSRGEAVEIGGGFRIPDVLRQSGATLVEVGTTNKTYVRDYEAAITENTGAILSIHASNFRVVGFTHAPSLQELTELGERSGIPVLHDLGSGCLLDTDRFGLAHEPMPQESVQDGASLAFFSGDKLLGGPQAGIIVGKSEFVDAVSKHPLARAVRIDKGSLAALNATLLHYLKDEAVAKIPIWEMISRSPEFLAQRAESWRLAIDGPHRRRFGRIDRWRREPSRERRCQPPCSLSTQRRCPAARTHLQRICYVVLRPLSDGSTPNVFFSIHAPFLNIWTM